MSAIDLKPGISVHMMVKDPMIERFCFLVESLQPYVDEFVILDTGSDARTKRVIKEWKKVRFFEAEFKDFCETRNNILKEHKFRWTLQFDWDELPTSGMIQHILGAGTHTTSALGWLYHRKNFYDGREAKSIPSDWHCRLWRTGRGKFYRPVHELIALDGKLESKTRGTPLLPKAPDSAYFLHSKTPEEQKRSNKLYTSMRKK